MNFFNSLIDGSISHLLMTLKEGRRSLYLDDVYFFFVIQKAQNEEIHCLSHVKHLSCPPSQSIH